MKHHPHQQVGKKISPHASCHSLSEGYKVRLTLEAKTQSDHKRHEQDEEQVEANSLKTIESKNASSHASEHESQGAHVVEMLHVVAKSHC